AGGKSAFDSSPPTRAPTVPMNSAVATAVSNNWKWNLFVILNVVIDAGRYSWGSPGNIKSTQENNYD
ncbi:MAG: hypothetical protein KAW12_08260, partial [Candidatus Aminicenantes bacterium]|nr:hypothetical protein [Candidatus Aminicenantes bacterium]